jgi:hypothetical protein
MNNIKPFDKFDSVEAIIKRHNERDGSNGGEPPMELTERVVQLEKHVADLRVDIASIKQRLDSELPHLSTHADVSKLESTMIKWFVATALTLVASVFAIMRFMN